MGGPIVRTGTTPEFWKNWDKIFGNGTAEKTTKKSNICLLLLLPLSTPSPFPHPAVIQTT